MEASNQLAVRIKADSVTATLSFKFIGRGAKAERGVIYLFEGPPVRVLEIHTSFCSSQGLKPGFWHSARVPLSNVAWDAAIVLLVARAC